MKKRANDAILDTPLLDMDTTTTDTLERRLGGDATIKEGDDADNALLRGPKRKGKWCRSPPPPPPSLTTDCLRRLMALTLAAVVALLPSPASSLIPEFLSYKTCVNRPPAFSGCMSNVTADFGERVVLNCQVGGYCSPHVLVARRCFLRDVR